MESIFCPKCGFNLGRPNGVENLQFFDCCNCDTTFKNPHFESNHRPKSKTPAPNNSTVNEIQVKIIYISIIIFLGFVVYMVIRLNSNESKSSSYESNNQESTQSESITAFHVTQDTYAATSEDMFHEMFKYFKVNDQDAINTLVYSGDMKLLPKGTELYLLGGNGFTYSIVRESGSTQELWVVPQHIAQN